jgi:hypothetical protein
MEGWPWPSSTSMAGYGSSPGERGEWVIGGCRRGGGVSAHGCLVRSCCCSVWCVCEEEDMEKKEREEREKEKRKREKEKERKNGKFAKPGNFRREK